MKFPNNVDFINDKARNCTDRTVPSLSTARTEYYPPVADDVIAGDILCSASTDWGLLTMLLQDDIDGLEFGAAYRSTTDSSPSDPWYNCRNYWRSLGEVDRWIFRRNVITTLLRSELLDADSCSKPVNSFEHVMWIHLEVYVIIWCLMHHFPCVNDIQGTSYNGIELALLEII
ncbi:unnamed protein product [Allacma fusca]|uniref:Uncharacterized protein n=1 Tax=Allacma fusca TaxID=39272 RepID=A0A8J2NYI3_9HEXA|nr:unnamed protein product [Allacma fusca]